MARILARAAELQQQRDVGSTGLGDIERAAEEAGIDPSLVRAAAMELDHRPSEAPRSGFFGPTRVSYQVTIDGEISNAELPRLNDAFQQAFGLPAMPSHLGRSLQWSYVDPQRGRSMMASVTMRDGRTTVRLQEGLGALMGGIYGGVGGGAGAGGVIPAIAIGGAVLLGPVGGVVGGLLGAVLSFFGTRALYLAISKAREAQLKRVFDALVRETEELARPVTSTASTLDEVRERVDLAAAPEVRAFPEQRTEGVVVPVLDELAVKR